MKLSQISTGRSVTVVAVAEGEGRRRLLDFGFCPGTRVAVQSVAPFSRTILVSLRGYTVALRENAAAQVEVRL
jgi:Fe2+ transport system protein FeoA